MLLERLREYAQFKLGDSLPPPGYQEQSIRYIISLGPEGQYEGLVELRTKESPRGLVKQAPQVKRTMGVTPKLLLDTGEYVLGIPRSDPKKPPNPTRVALQHASFRQLVAACASATNEPAVRAVATFLEHPDVVDVDSVPAFDPGFPITFRVDGVYPFELDAVKAFWAVRMSSGTDASTTDDADTCLVCGNAGPVLERHPFKIKGIPGGQAQKDLISANADPFESYGLKASRIAPTCSTCAEAYANALNALLGSKSTSMWAGGLAYAFWPDPRADIDDVVITLFTQPQAHPDLVRSYMQSFWSRSKLPPEIDATRYYGVALGASGARVVVKDWIDTTIGERARSIGRYFVLQELVDWNGEQGDFLPLMWLSGSTVRRKEEPPDIVTQSLVRLALAGTPLPMDLLYLAVRRNRAEQDVTRQRAALIKMVFTSRLSDAEIKENTMAKLDATRDDPAYVCGRLLATIDRVQRSALGNPNATVIDKFYGSASSAPASVFGNLLDGAQAHLNKLRKERRGAYVNLDKQLQDVMDLIDNFPPTLNLKDQGLFALGFYHQRAADRAAVSARKAALAPAEAIVTAPSDEDDLPI